MNDTTTESHQRKSLKGEGSAGYRVGGAPTPTLKASRA